MSETRVIVVRKDQVGMPDPFAIASPNTSIVYQWVRTSVFGERDTPPLTRRLAKGWVFVSPNVHPNATIVALGDAVKAGDFILMQNSISHVESEHAKDKEKADAKILAMSKELAAMGIDVELI